MIKVILDGVDAEKYLEYLASNKTETKVEIVKKEATNDIRIKRDNELLKDLERTEKIRVPLSEKIYEASKTVAIIEDETKKVDYMLEIPDKNYFKLACEQAIVKADKTNDSNTKWESWELNFIYSNLLQDKAKSRHKYSFIYNNMKNGRTHASVQSRLRRLGVKLIRV